MERLVTCEFCGIKCSKFYNLKRHIKNKHNVEIISSDNCQKPEKVLQRRKRPLKCGICDVQGMKQQLDVHYTEDHNLDLNIEHISFLNHSTFLEWKLAIEKENHCRYIATCGRKEEKERYSCHRSGDFRSKGKGLRSLKRQGSKKIGSYCPSKIIVTSKDEICQVKFVKTHVGHENELCHVTIPSDIKAKIAHRLSQGIPPVIVMEELKNSSLQNDLFRQLSMKDMYNISREFKIYYNGKPDYNNDTDLSKFIEELTTTTNYDSILYYKPYQAVDENYAEITDKDFLLIIMNQTQNELFQLHGKNIVIIDRTWRISYNLHLIMLLVLDESQQAFPCCFLISNKDDESRLEVIFTILKSKIGAMRTKLLMTCISNQYYISWANVMGFPDRHLYSPWSVNQAWNLNLPRIKNPEKLRQVTEMLNALVEEPDAKKFPQLLNDMVGKITGQEENRQFGHYFCKHFLRQVVKWARCYRIQLGITDTTDLEEICKIIKCIYYTIKRNGGLSYCILFLFRFSRDKLFNKRVIHSRDEICRQLQCLKRNHTFSTSKDYIITANETNSWLLTSAVEKSVHEIKVNNSSCRCNVYCDICQSCAHHYVCSCTESSIEWNMCHHIHYLCTNLQNNDVLVDNTVCFVNDFVIGFNDSHDMNYFTNNDTYKEQEEEEKIIEEMDDDFEINAVLEINSLVDEIIASMRSDENRRYVIRNFKKILETLKSRNADSLDPTSIN